MNYFTKNTPIGEITVAEEAGFVTNVSFDKSKFKGNFGSNDSLEEVFTQLDEYFEGRRKEFTIPLNPKGTAFQQKIWSILYTIPYGETRTYKEIAELAGNSGASRAVGNANNKNPIAIIIPCHRVIGASGELTGYAGGLDIKRKLIELEKKSSL